MRVPVIASLACLLVATGCAGSGWKGGPSDSSSKEPGTSYEAWETIQRFKKKDPSLQRFFKNAYGYAVFPTIGKGGLIVGGAYGKGEVYAQGEPIGTAEMVQGTVGLQVGGQSYSELIFFADERALDRFRSGNFELGAGASAVAVTAGASANASYDNGIAIFTVAKGGLMAEATVSGQQFNFWPK
jgi:lipid-binding SYLF domain-containing protein